MVATVARLVESVLSLAPKVHFLATCREPLRAEGERIRRLDPLPLPAIDMAMGVADTASHASVEAFMNRAAKSSPSFQLSAATAPLVAEICRRVDGIPLALEIAAARLDSFEPAALVQLLKGRFLLQMLGRSTAPLRHQTLSATLDWSYDALSPLAQMACRRLSVFRGAFSFDAARHIVAGDGIAADDIGSLIACLTAKSLVVAGGQAPGRHRLLNTTRAYLADKLEQSGEWGLVALRHAAYYSQWNTAAALRIDTARPGDWKCACGEVQDEVRSALEWASSPAGDADRALQLLLSALPVWMHLGLVQDCLTWIARVKALPGLPEAAGEMLKRELSRAPSLIGHNFAQQTRDTDGRHPEAQTDG
jgi:predicted ATPase